MKNAEDNESLSSFTLSNAIASDTLSTHSPSIPHSPSEEVSGKLKDDNTQYIEDTLLLDDVHLFEGGMDTQILDLDGQTQVLDHLGETQVLDERNIAVSVTGEDEGCGDTEYLGDTQVLSGNDSPKTGHSGLLDIQSTPKTCLKKDTNRDSKTMLGVMNNGEQCSGSMVRGFTSVRAASLKACGLAARDRALNIMNTKPHSTRSDSLLQIVATDKVTCQLEDEGNQQNNCEDFARMNKSSFKNLHKIGSSTVRKLFTADKICHTKQADDGNKHDKSSSGSFLFKKGLRDLTYVNSKEPGKLSEANALEVVDEFLELNVVDGDSDVVLKKSTRGKGKFSSAAKGVRSLAKKVNSRSAIGLSGVYYWDDNCEDEGGGEFFQKKKNLFFSKSDQKHSTKKGAKSRATCQKTRDKIVSNIVDVGCDTQMAADAMENLCVIGVNDKTLNTVQDIDRKETCPCGNLVLTRQSKKARTCVEDQTSSCLTSSGLAKNTKKQMDKQIEEKKTMKAKTGFKDYGMKKQRTVVKMSDQTEEDNKNRVAPTPVTNRSRGSLCLSRVASGEAKSKYRKITDVANSSIIKATKVGTLLDKDKAQKHGNLNPGHVSQSSTEIPSYSSLRRTRSQLQSANQEASNQENRMSKRLKADAKCPSIHKAKNKNHSSAHVAKTAPACVSKVAEKNSCNENLAKMDVVVCLEASPRDSCIPSVSGIENAASPVCMGDGYHKQSCRKYLERSFLKREINSLITTIPTLISPVKESSKRRDIVSVRVMFSRHLNSRVIKQQRKILTRLGALEASSMSDASHFVTDVFVGTKNMLLAIAFGKPVVTHLWLESCAQGSCFIDESSYILRDAKKEKELGFTMPFSLACASRNPILKGQRVFITPNTKPSKEILTSLIKAVHGLVVERLGRASMTYEKLGNDLLIISCEEDYDICLTFLEKGASVYSSKLLLNGIVTQRLEYQRYLILMDKVKEKSVNIVVKKTSVF